MDPHDKREEITPREMITASTCTTANGKSCVDCRTTKTPLWRSGPSGPKSLCNACGIRHRKRRAAAATVSLNLNRAGEKIGKDGENSGKSKKRVSFKNGKYDQLSVEWRQRLTAFREGVAFFQKQRSQSKKKRQKLGEVEQAAVLLMSLSCGSVYA